VAVRGADDTVELDLP
jgi:ComF family protein